MPAPGDYDGDGLSDMMMADPDGARIFFWKGSKKMGLPPIEYPAPSGIQSLDALTLSKDGPQAISVCAPSENFLGVSSLQRSGRLTFPKVFRSRR